MNRLRWTLKPRLAVYPFRVAPFPRDASARCIFTVRYLRPISILMVVAGLAAVVVSEAFDLNTMWTVTGMLLLVAGLVKVAMVYVWQNIAGIGSAPRDDT